MSAYLRVVFATHHLQSVLAGHHSAGRPDSVLAQFLRLSSLGGVDLT
jgi:hypothetical protein